MGDINVIKKLRDRTGLSFDRINKALDESGGDEDKAVEILKSQGTSIAKKKSSRETGQGVIEAYIHSNKKVGSLVQLFCETDFVASNKEFTDLAHEIAMQIASMNPEDEQELMEQDYIKDQKLTIEKLIQQVVAKLGENIKVGEFIRFNI